MPYTSSFKRDAEALQKYDELLQLFFDLGNTLEEPLTPHISLSEVLKKWEEIKRYCNDHDIE